MTELARPRLIDSAALDARNYFTSLMEQAGRRGLTGTEDRARIGAECAALLADRTAKLTQGRSSSIRTETAQELASSILYTLSVELKSRADADAALSAVLHEPLSGLYAAGLERILRMTAAAQVQWRHIGAELFETENVFYRATVIDGIGGFFKLYRPEFFAHETHITADYPPFPGLPEADGIEFIKRYLDRLEAENGFCRHFAPRRVRALLRGLDGGYAQAVMNIYEPVLVTALGCVLTGCDVGALCCDAEELSAVLRGRDRARLLSVLSAAAEGLCTGLDCTALERGYVMRSLPRIAGTLERALRWGHLSAVVPRPVEEA
ncbi:MAG: DUF6179 domain-containing protein [Eubacteriales bacterium]|nr:DUF6179 domain-containing protein [Eubacteriales bacterium]